MATKLTKTQSAVMNWMDKGWKAYNTYGNRVEINGKRICTTETMASLERAGLVEREGVRAWTVTDAGRAWRGPVESNE